MSLLGTLVTVPNGTKLRNPEGVDSASPGRKPWDYSHKEYQSPKGRNSLCRPYSTKLTCGVSNMKGTCHIGL